MPAFHSVFFLGGDTRIRAEVTNRFSENGWQISPADSFAELDAIPRAGGVALSFIEDSGEVTRIQEQMADRGQWLPIITCSKSVDHRLIVQAIQAGAQGHLIWPFEIEEFAKILAEAEARMDWYVHRQSAKSAARRRLEPLSRRERDVLAALARFGSNKRIALELDLSPRTVEIYRSKIMQRLGVDHIAQALWIAFQSEEFAAEPLSAGSIQGPAATMRLSSNDAAQSGAAGHY